MSGSAVIPEIVEASWERVADRERMIEVRRTVFIVEQKVPLAIELDGVDPACRHLLALDPRGRAIGTARMQSSGHIGRIAVVSDLRGRGVGSRLVEEMIARARAVCLASVDLDAQVQALGFYEKLGFVARGDVFMEAGIPHQNMRKQLA